MISCTTVQKPDIRLHYDLTTLFYRLLWGRHIHHGLWDLDANGQADTATLSATAAAVRLTETLAQLAVIRPHDVVLDVGCGMGGSSIHLARTLDCQVTGITLSPFQRMWARQAAFWAGVRKSTDFRCQDAERAEFPEAHFDIVWSIECTEHLFDKPAFFQKTARWLKPGGRLAICAWLAGDAPLSESATKQVYDVCEGFFCPSLGSRDDYAGWFADAGLTLVEDHDWTARVSRTWELCAERVRRTGVRRLARLLHQDTVMFLDRFTTLLRAYQTGAMKYGCFIATRP
ncbi:MAG: methyltransferase domain-containing protein [Planctomycetes bacterium]|nr:methyltransferase domain-containing protein [Planctomycetota bacterium]